MNVLTVEEANKMILPGRTKEEYQKDYDYIIELAKPRGLDKSKIDFYCETHHIKCRCLGGTDEYSNLVNLSFLEHVTVHILLYHIYKNEPKIICAAIMMISCQNKARSREEVDKIISELDLNIITQLKTKSLYVNSIKVICVDVNNIIYGIFDSTIDAERNIGLNNATIGDSVREGKLLFKKYYWYEFNNYYKHNKELVDKFLELDKSQWPKFTIPDLRHGKKFKVICADILTNKILYIFKNLDECSYYGFNKKTVSEAASNRGQYKNGIVFGYRWMKEYNWENKNEIEEFLKNRSKFKVPIPKLIRSGLLKLDKNNNILNEYSAVYKAEREIGHLIFPIMLKTSDKIFEAHGYNWCRLNDYIELFEDKWLDYLRHKQLTK